jgi:hypothetical protein
MGKGLFPTQVASEACNRLPITVPNAPSRAKGRSNDSVEHCCVNSLPLLELIQQVSATLKRGLHGRGCSLRITPFVQVAHCIEGHRGARGAPRHTVLVPPAARAHHVACPGRYRPGPCLHQGETASPQVSGLPNAPAAVLQCAGACHRGYLRQGLEGVRLVRALASVMG